MHPIFSLLERVDRKRVNKPSLAIRWLHVRIRWFPWRSSSDNGKTYQWYRPTVMHPDKRLLPSRGTRKTGNRRRARFLLPHHSLDCLVFLLRDALLTARRADADADLPDLAIR